MGKTIRVVRALELGDRVRVTSDNRTQFGKYGTFVRVEDDAGIVVIDGEGEFRFTAHELEYTGPSASREQRRAELLVAATRYGKAERVWRAARYAKPQPPGWADAHNEWAESRSKLLDAAEDYASTEDEPHV